MVTHRKDAEEFLLGTIFICGIMTVDIATWVIGLKMQQEMLGDKKTSIKL